MRLIVRQFKKGENKTCEFKSGIIFKNRIELTKGEDESHSNLLESLGVVDSDMNAMKMFVRAELIPPHGEWWTNPNEWIFNVDQDIVPEWFEMDKAEYEKKFRNEIIVWWEKHVLVNQKIDRLSDGYYRLKGCEVDTLDNRVIVWLDNSIVKKMYDSSIVQWMWNNSIVQSMWNNSIVQGMWNNSIVRSMWNNSIVQWMWNDSIVQEMYGNSIVRLMRNNSTVQEMYDSSIVQEMHDSSIVQMMYDSSMVQVMWNNSIVQSMSEYSIAFSYKKDGKIKIMTSDIADEKNYFTLIRNDDIQIN